MNNSFFIFNDIFTNIYEKMMVDRKLENNKLDMTKLDIDEKYDTVLYLVRHGQSIGNAKREFLGHTDKDLSELGYRQASRTAEFMAWNRIDAVYSSDLIRAHNTALPHAEMRGLCVIDSKNLREMYAGDWEGQKVEDIIAKSPSEFLDGWRESFGTYTLPNGENVQDAAQRIYREVMSIARENSGKHVLIGCHAAAIRAFWGKITKTPPEELAAAYQYPDNASVSVVYFDGEELIPGEYSHSSHLTDLC